MTNWRKRAASGEYCRAVPSARHVIVIKVAAILEINEQKIVGGCGTGNCRVNGSQASRGHFLLHFIALRLKWRQEKGVEISSEIIKTSSCKRPM
ncbi:Protein outspread [Temnothorax longispinosus]|uniref:Protein outspread n=1 Tax=Temnothorax longispinosus TaxID=300112 RepID=A0A4V3S9M3_9HYME|nr:Protein outspread [Temnothorax longispinosus]